MTTKPEDALVERCARAILEADTTEMLFQDGFPERDATKLARAAIEASGITTLLERERRLREALAAIERTAFVGATSEAKQVALESIEDIARAALTGMD